MSIKNFFKKYAKILGIGLALIISVLIFLFRDQFVRLQGYGIFGLFILSILGNATIILPVPVILTAFVGGAVFNPFVVALAISLGATIGELTGYFAGYGAEGLINRDQRIKKVKKYMERYGLWVILVLAAIPNPLFDLAGITAGATGIPVKKYFAVVWLGKFIKFGVLAFLGSRSVILLDKFI